MAPAQSSAQTFTSLSSAAPRQTPALTALVDQSVAVLQDVLNDPNLAPMERAQIALQILELTQGTARSPQSPLGKTLAIAQGTIGTVGGVPNGDGSEPPNGLGQSLNGSDGLVDGENGLDNSLLQTPGLTADVATVPPWATYQEILPARCARIDNFLSEADNQQALAIALEHQENFVESNTTTNANNYRQSSVLYATYYTELYHLLRKRILKVMPTVVKELGMASFLVSQVEMQMTAHGDGCFYKIHNDSGSPDTATRVLTYVYYFHQEPKAYSDGALRIYETDVAGPATEPSAAFEDVVPDNNSIVFFDSQVKHEVLPVVCPSKKFEDSRFTLNGWLRQV